MSWQEDMSFFVHLHLTICIDISYQNEGRVVVYRDEVIGVPSFFPIPWLLSRIIMKTNGEIHMYSAKDLLFSSRLLVGNWREKKQIL